MATTKLKLKIGVADDPTALQPSLNDCLTTLLDQAPGLMAEVLQGLVRGAAPVGPQSVAAFQSPALKAAILSLERSSLAVIATYKDELAKVMYHGGGKEQVATEVLRYEDLQLFGEAELDQSIEVARAQQEVTFAVDDVLPTLDSLVSTLLGWRTIQPGLNPLRPEVFVRALQATLALHVTDNPVREVLIAPAGGLLGANLRRLYRELSDWLLSTGVEPAVPIGGKLQAGGTGPSAAGSVAKTMLTLDRLRKLLAGDFDPPPGKQEFLHTVPASMSLLQEMKQVDQLVKRLEQRPKPAVPAAPPQPVASHEAAPTPRLGRQLGEEVLRLMFETLAQDQRLLPSYKQELRTLEPAVHRLASQDSRFFSDRTHPARQFLDRVTQRSLAFKSETDEGWPRFMESVRYAVRWLTESKVVDGDTFGELLDHLQKLWTDHDQNVRSRREEAARALLHAEQRNLLAQKLAADFSLAVEGLDVAPFVLEFLTGSWAQVVAEAQLSCADGSDDPFGYRALVDDLVWSVQKTTAQRNRARRLAQMVPGLLAKLREGLERIDYPPELTQRFFDGLVTIHQAAMQGAEDAAVKQAAQALEEAAAAPPAAEAAEPWLADGEAQESGWVDGDSFLPEDFAVADVPPPEAEGPEARPAGPHELRTGTWAELVVQGQWTRVQLTWASPHSTLFMFTSLAGTAHSMSRRTLDRLRSQGMLRVIADRPVVDDAFDQVAQAALKNSLDDRQG